MKLRLFILVIIMLSCSIPTVVSIDNSYSEISIVQVLHDQNIYIKANNISNKIIGKIVYSINEQQEIIVCYVLPNMSIDLYIVKDTYANVHITIILIEFY